jgi:hypothetical protein
MNSQETEERNHTQLGRNKGKRDETVSLKFEGFSQKSTQACQWSVLAIPGEGKGKTEEKNGTLKG